MLNLFVKSALYYTFFKKYGRKILFVLSIVIFIILVNFVYSDIVEYLTLNDMKDKLIYALLIKWFLVLLGIVSIVYIVKSAVFPKDKVVVQMQTDTKSEGTKQKVKSSIEEDLICKNELKSHGDKLIEEMKKRKLDAK